MKIGTHPASYVEADGLPSPPVIGQRITVEELDLGTSSDVRIDVIRDIDGVRLYFAERW